MLPVVGPFAVTMVRRGRNGSDHYDLGKRESASVPLEKITWPVGRTLVLAESFLIPHWLIAFGCLCINKLI